MNTPEPAQVDEVVARLREEKEATLVHVPTNQEVQVYLDQYNAKAPWRILYNMDDRRWTNCLDLGHML